MPVVTGDITKLAGTAITSGEVRFTATKPIVQDPTAQTTSLATSTAQHVVSLDGGGAFSVSLPQTGDDWVYRVEVNAYVGGNLVHGLPKLLLEVPASGADLSGAGVEGSPSGRVVVNRLVGTQELTAAVAPIQATADNALSVASSARATAGEAKSESGNAVDRVENLETLGGVAPGDVNDANMALHINQPDSQARTALNAATVQALDEGVAPRVADSLALGGPARPTLADAVALDIGTEGTGPRTAVESVAASTLTGNPDVVSAAAQAAADAAAAGIITPVVPDAVKSGMLVSFGGTIYLDFTAGTMTLPASTRVTVDSRSVTVVGSGGAPMVVPIPTAASIFRVYFDTTKPQNPAAFVIRTTAQGVGDLLASHVLLGTYSLPYQTNPGGAFLHGGPVRTSIDVDPVPEVPAGFRSGIISALGGPIAFDFTAGTMTIPNSTRVMTDSRSITVVATSGAPMAVSIPTGSSIYRLYFDTTKPEDASAFTVRSTVQDATELMSTHVLLGTYAVEYQGVPAGVTLHGGPVKIAGQSSDEPEEGGITWPLLSPAPAGTYAAPAGVQGRSTAEVDPAQPADLYALYDALPATPDGAVSVRTLGYAQDPAGGVDESLPILEYHYAPYRADVAAGTPVPRLLIQSTIHGYEGAVPYATYEWFKDMLAGDNPISEWIRQNLDVHLIPCANPWGFANNKRTNSRGVDLNRHFAEGWGPSSPGTPEDPNTSWSGNEPMTENESLVLDAWYGEYAAEAVAFMDLHNIGGAPRPTSQGDYGLTWVIADGERTSPLARQVIGHVTRVWRQEYPELGGQSPEIQFGYSSTLSGGNSMNQAARKHGMPAITCDTTWGSPGSPLIDAPMYGESAIRMNVDVIGTTAIGMARSYI